MIAVVAIRHFCIAVEQHADPTLADVPLLLVVDQGPGPPTILDAAPAARAYGVQVGSTLRQALLGCPNAIVRPAAPQRYQATLADVLAALAQLTDRVEADPAPWTTRGDIPSDAVVQIALDLGQVDGAALPACALRIGQTVRRQMRLDVALGLAETRFLATVAAQQVRANHARVVTPGRASAFLAPLPITVLPLPPEQLHWLGLLGIQTIGAFATLPERAVLAQLGTTARRVHALARGVDPTPVGRYRAPERLSCTRAFDPPVQERAILIAIITAQASRLASRLERRGQAARRVTLRLELEDGTIWEDHLGCTPPASTVVHLRDTLSALVRRPQIGCGVTMLTSRLGDLAPLWASQHDLGLFPAAQPRVLEATLSDLITCFGAACFLHVTPAPQPTVIPEQQFVYQQRDGTLAGEHNRAKPIRVICTAPDHFRTIVWQGQSHRVDRIVERWRIDTRWWQQRVWREYVHLTTRSGLLLTIARDCVTDEWYLEDIHD